MTHMKLSLLLIVTLIISVNAIRLKDECQLIIQQWIDNPFQLPPIVYADSGKFLNDLGDYNNCLYNRQSYVYITLKVLNKLAGYQYMGFCIPIQCKTQVLEGDYAQSIKDNLNKIYNDATKTQASPFIKMQFYDPLQTTPQIDWSNYLVIALVGGLFLLCIIASVVVKTTTSESLPIKAIKCFSLYDNFKKIVNMPAKHQNQNLLFLNGTRTLSIFWIVFGHGMWVRIMNIKNWLDTITIMQTPGIATLTCAAYFAVDTFFWIGAFLVTIGMLPQLKKASNFTKFYFGALLHRFIRIWPTYMIAILIYWKIAPLLGSGPIWINYQLLTNACKNGGILWNMFFLDNFDDHGPSGMDYCFGWGWYLAVDFQLFLITPFILLAYLKNKKLGLALSFMIFIASIITAFILIMVNDWRYPIPNPKMKPQPQFMDQFYFRPYIRASAYIMGMFTGFLYYQWKENNEKVVKIINKIKNSITIRILFYVFGIFLCQFTIWIILPFQQGQEWTTLGQAFYNSLNRVGFLLGVFLCTFAAMFGCKNDPAKFILGHAFFGPLAKVSFCVYLTHLIVILDGVFSARMDLYWQPLSSIYIVITDIFWSILSATFLSLIIQSPILGLQKIFLQPSGKNKKQQKPEMKIQFKEDIGIKRSLLDDEDYDNRKSTLSI